MKNHKLLVLLFASYVVAQVDLPDYSSKQPWGGSQPNVWIEESVVANAASEAINFGWNDYTTDKVSDVIVAIPTTILNSNYHPYADGQSNSKMSFGGYLFQTHYPPLVATLIVFENMNTQKSYVEAQFRIDKSFGFSASTTSNLTIQMLNQHYTVSAQIDKDGNFWAYWPVPSSFEWNTISSILIKPFMWQDWFPVTFYHPVKTEEQLVEEMSSYGITIDPENLKTTTSSIAFDNAMRHDFPPTYENGGYPYVNEDIHGVYNGENTSVGEGWTWVTYEPFKHIYTCFSARTFDLEGQTGAPSGAGLHLIGEVEEVIINSLEPLPLFLGHATTKSAAKGGLSPPTGSFVYGLQDVATFRLLQPGEGQETVTGDYHWYAFEFDRNVCTEEWIYPCNGNQYWPNC